MFAFKCEVFISFHSYETLCVSCKYVSTKFDGLVFLCFCFFLH